MRMHDPSTGVGRFDSQTCQALWKYAEMAWGDGWPMVRVSPESEESEDEAAVDITPLPRKAIKDLGDGRYKFRSHSVQATSMDAAWPSLDAAWQEEQERTVRVH